MCLYPTESTLAPRKSPMIPLEAKPPSAPTKITSIGTSPPPDSRIGLRMLSDTPINPAQTAKAIAIPVDSTWKT